MYTDKYRLIDVSGFIVKFLKILKVRDNVCSIKTNVTFAINLSEKLAYAPCGKRGVQNLLTFRAHQ